MKQPLFMQSNCSLDLSWDKHTIFQGSCPSAMGFHFDLTHCNFVSAFCQQRKEWAWDESKMVVMHDPVYRYVGGRLHQPGPTSPERRASILLAAELPPPRLPFQRTVKNQQGCKITADGKSFSYVFESKTD